jgi:hypothetical protein
MASIVISGDTSGAVTLTVPATAGTRTATFPAATGTVMVSGNMPAFSAYLSSIQNVTNATFTKIQINVEEFDTANCYDNTTNYRFTPTTEGYYQFNCNINWNFPGSGLIGLSTLYKNGVEFKRCGQLIPNSTNVQASGSALIYMNGSTDYVELYGYQNSGSTQAPSQGQATVFFQAIMVRAA